MRLLLTGASGFIGKNFLENAPKDMEIIAIYNNSKDIEKFVKSKKLSNVSLHKCDLAKKEDVEKLSKKIGNEFSHCLFLAGNVDIPLSTIDPFQDVVKNVGTLINFLQNFKIQRFIYMSTAAVYDGNKGEVNAKTNLDPRQPYCISKLAAEQYVKFFQKIGKIKEYVIIRFGGAYGKYSPKKFASKLVNDVLVQQKDSIEVYGDGTNIVNLMYVKDTVKALLAALNSKKSDLICNLGQDNMTITQLVHRVGKIFGKNLEIKYVPKLSGQKYITFSLQSDFSKTFNFKSDYSFEEGIKEFGASIRNQN